MRMNLQDRHGFTIIELIIVVAIIGILAALTLVAYGSIQSSARDKSVLSDSENVTTEVTRYSTKNSGALGSAVTWYSKGSANPNIVFTPSSGNVIDVVASTTAYCVRVYNTAASQYKSLATAYKSGSTSGACDSLTPSTAALIDSPIQNGAVVTFLAGSGSSGSTDGTGTGASFAFNSAVIPGIAADSSGNIYVADYGSNGIRKITPAGVVSTFGGSIYRPGGVVVDSAGNVYTSSSNANIRKITPSGTASIFVGSPSSNQTGYTDATGTAARFGLNPGNLVIDSDDNIYVADGTNQKIRKVTPAGVVTTYASVTGSPRGIAIDSDNNIYIVTSGNVIKKITPSGTQTTFYSDPSGNLSGLTVDINGNVYVTTYTKVVKITPAGSASDFVGNGSAATVDGTGTAAQTQNAISIGTDKTGAMYIIEAGGSYRVRKVQ